METYPPAPFAHSNPNEYAEHYAVTHHQLSLVDVDE